MSDESQNDEALEALKQADIRSLFAKNGTEAWTTVYQSGSGPSGEPALFSAFAPPSYRESAVSEPSWDLSIGDGEPGFSQSYRDGTATTSYSRINTMNDGVEPLVILQHHHGLRDSPPQIAEEFRLLFNLWRDPKTGNLIHIADDGSETIAAEVTDDHVRVRTSFLRRYQAARQMDLLMFIDSRAHVETLSDEVNLSELSEQERTDTTAIDVYAGRLTGERPFSRYFGTKVLPPQALETCGLWPFDDRDEDFPEFIIAEDDSGRPIKHTCDPDRLANYFGANPDAPHYLTPVFFRRDVLQRYFEEPRKYEVRDGYLSCGGLWGVQIDNDHPDFVCVFLGDLGRDLPESERPYWITFNVPPSSEPSDTNTRRSFLAQFADPQSEDLRFKSTYRRFQESWRAVLGWDLFRPPHTADRHLLTGLRVPLNDSQPEFEKQLETLAKLIVDSLNDSELAKVLPTKIDGEKSIAKLERWLEQEGYPHVDRDIALLRKLQALRSRVAAHRKGSNYEKFLAKEVGDADSQEAIRRIFEELITMMSDLEEFFAQENEE